MLYASVVVPQLYLLLPIAAAAIALYRAKRTKNGNPIRELVATSVTGAVGGLILVTIYMRSFTGNVSAGQVALACYWGIAVACVVRGFNDGLAWAFARITPRPIEGQMPSRGWDIASAISRSALLLCLGVPYIGAMALIYRPHVIHRGTPTTILGAPYHDVRFASTDGLRLRGWWIPAGSEPSDSASSAQWGERTVILCHGFNGDKAADLRLVRDLAPSGFNILAFDFRAHGQSDGEVTTFGDLERRDVLGAVRWLQQNHAAESKKIFGLGEGLGAVALIAAAADPDEGRSINAIAVFGPYDSLPQMLTGLSHDFAVPTVGWMATHMGLPMAGFQLGTPMANFAPVRMIDQIAPRPVLIIANQADPTIDISLSQTVYQEASQPKYSYWVKGGNRYKMLFGNDKVLMTVRVFFETAHDVL
jgi:pimeloyl-ACP methyl ester carboxylesterase